MYSYNGGAFTTVMKNFNIATNNGPLPSAFLFGFAGSTGGARNVHEITCFAAQPLGSASSAGANTVQGGQVQSNTQVYFASYNNNSWSGTVTANALSYSSSNGFTVATTATWDANCVLTGWGPTNVCTNTGNSTLTAAESPASRVLLTWDGTQGIPFEWSSGITAAQQATLNTNVSNAADTNGSIRLDWLRGGRSNEIINSGILRARSGVLGDIINSSPVWVGPPLSYYPPTFIDALNSTTGSETSYTTFSTSNAGRLNVVYAGSNDGLLHAFRAGTTTSTTYNDGKEVLGFMPSTVLSNSNITSPNVAPNVDVLTDPTYQHNYFVDATPGTGDLYYNNAWHTWLVGGLGQGGSEIYALDITNPGNFSEAHASSLVVGDWTPSAISSLGCTTTGGVAVTSCGSNLGSTYGTPQIVRMHNGKWAIVFGNGTGSTSGVAGIYIGIVNSTTGAVSFVWLGTNSTTGNGISYVSPADIDGDAIVDYFYAGDQLGNVWRFDVTDSNPSNWKTSAYGNGTTPTPLFSAKDSGGNVQPITSSILPTIDSTGGGWRIILGFGTGKSTPFPGNVNPPVNTYQSGTQTVYGIWDWDMAGWNSKSPMQFLSLTGTQSITRSKLLANSVASETANTRTVNQSTVCWINSTTCSPLTADTQYGWLFDLPDSVSSTACGGTTCNEQIVYNPLLIRGQMVLNTTIPPSSTPGQCSMPTTTGWTQAFNMTSGGGTPQNFFTGGGLGLGGTGASVMAEKFNGTGTVYSVTASDGTSGIVMQTSGGGSGGGGGGGGGGSSTGPAAAAINAQGSVIVSRVSWEVLK
jgi:type IV pilus assembly protein PilY1